MHNASPPGKCITQRPDNKIKQAFITIIKSKNIFKAICLDLLEVIPRAKMVVHSDIIVYWSRHFVMVSRNDTRFVSFGSLRRACVYQIFTHNVALSPASPGNPIIVCYSSLCLLCGKAGLGLRQSEGYVRREGTCTHP